MGRRGQCDVSEENTGVSAVREDLALVTENGKLSPSTASQPSEEGSSWENEASCERKELEQGHS